MRPQLVAVAVTEPGTVGGAVSGQAGVVAAMAGLGKDELPALSRETTA